jgi:hypothetical protein
MSLPTNRRFATQLFNSLAALSSPDPVAAVAEDEQDPNPLDSVPDAVKKQLLSLQVLFPNEFVPALDVLDRRLVTRFRVRSSPAVSVHQEEGAHHGDYPQDVTMQLADEQEGDQMQINDDARYKENTPTLDVSVRNEEATTTTPDQHINSSYDDNDQDSKVLTYYVRSAQHHRSSRYTTTSSHDPTPTYQVRLAAWNCSCPAFTFAAFPAVPDSTPHTTPVDPCNQVPASNAHDDNDDDDTVPDKTWCFGGVSLGNDMPPVCKHLLACLLAERCTHLFARFVHDAWVSVDEAAGWAAGWGD